MGRAFEFRKERKMKRWSKMAKTFTRIGKDIVIAVKHGGGDPETNSRLRQIIQNAKAANMPKENVTRAIKKASSKDTDNYEEISLEGYGPHGIGIFVDCATNNNNRTVADVRSYFNKCNGSLGTNGSLEYIFNRTGVFTINQTSLQTNIENFEMELIEAGLEKMEVNIDLLTVYCPFSDFNSMQLKIEELKAKIIKAEILRVPNNLKYVSLDQAKEVIKLIDLLEENDDVQQVSHNMKLTTEIIELIQN